LSVTGVTWSSPACWVIWVIWVIWVTWFAAVAWISRVTRRSVAGGGTWLARVVAVRGCAGIYGIAEGAEAADEQEELTDRRFLLHRREALGGLKHGGPRRVLGIVTHQGRAVGPDHFRLRDHVEGASRVDHHVHVRERLKPRPEP
jgi:hypothetical protein